MGQKPHRASLPVRGRTAVLVAISIGVSPWLTGCGGSLASATTSLRGVQDAVVVHADGSVVAASNGLHLRPSDVVRTGNTGRAELHTRGRVVYVGSAAAVQVVDGAHDDLRTGAVVIDAQNGPGLTVALGGLTATTPAGTATRDERAGTVRVAALAGAAHLENAIGRRVEVAALTQALVVGDALPDSTQGSPLRLTDDDGEAHAVPTLVRDDVALNALAEGIDTTGPATVRTVSASWHNALQPLPAGVAGSEQVLAIVIAAAGGAVDATTRYDAAVGLRGAGASWGVVAHRLGVGSDAVLAALDAFEHGAATGQIGSVPQALAFLTSGSRSTSGNQQPSSRPTAERSPTATPTASPSQSPTGVVDSTIDQVLSLLPTPLPSVSVPVTLPSVPVLGSVTPAPLPTPSP